MESKKQELFPVGQFALVCEQMNEFARLLRGSSKFGTVKAGADIRYYEDGWRLEKWIEAELDKEQGFFAAWWLEIGPRDNGWIIESSLAVNPDAFYIGLKDRFAASPQEVGQQLSDAVEELKCAHDQNKQFAEEIKKRRHIGL